MIQQQNVCQSQLDSPLVATNHGSTVNAKKAVKAGENAMDKCRTNPTSNNINEYKNCQANARKVTKENKRKSWHEYVPILTINDSQITVVLLI